jgi:hypothetical protein
VGPSVGGIGRFGLACEGGGDIRCKKSVGGAQVTCVGVMGVYENGTYVYNGILVYLYVVVVSISKLCYWLPSKISNLHTQRGWRSLKLFPCS